LSLRPRAARAPLSSHRPHVPGAPLAGLHLRAARARLLLPPLLLLALVALTTACGSSAAPPAPTPTRAPTSAASAAQVAAGVSPLPKPAASPSAAAGAAAAGASPSAASAASPAAQGAPVSASSPKQFSAPPSMQIDPAKHYSATFDTSQGSMTADLFASEAPLTVNNFVFLARQGFYDGVTFHRVINNFMIQTGDPTGTGTGGPGYQFKDEPVSRKYERGTVAMANAGPNTNGSQFFIVQGANVNLPPNYTIFGKLTSGLDTLDKIATTPTGPGRGGPDTPRTPITINTVTITES